MMGVVDVRDDTWAKEMLEVIPESKRRVMGLDSWGKEQECIILGKAQSMKA